MSTTSLTWPLGADVPGHVPPGHQLGRTVNLAEARNRYGNGLVDLLTHFYNVGDEPGYRAYVALREMGGEPGQARRMFNQAVEQGIDSVANPPQELVDLFKQLDEIPEWVDWDQLHRGSVAYWRAGKLVVMAIAYSAIGRGFRTYGGTRELVMSRRLIDRDQTGRRLIESLRWAANASKPGGMRRFDDGFRMTMKVRWVHAAVRYHCSRDETWDWDDWGVSVDATDGLYTMGTLFTEAVTDSLMKIGVPFSRRDLDDIAALWRYVGYVMGVPEDINWTDWNDLKRKSAVIQLLEHPADDGCRALLRALIDYMCEEKIDGYTLLPPALDDRMTADQKKELTYGLMRGWAGDELCDQMDIPDSGLRRLIPVARPLVRAYFLGRRARGSDDVAAAHKALEDFGVALRLEPGAPEIAIDDDVVERFQRFGNRYRELTRT